MVSMTNIETDEWRAWSPGLDDIAEMTLRAVIATLPGAGPDEIDQMVRLLENPASPYALPGAASLKHHDCIHVLLGRGLLNQDEAFVIGFTMGTAKEDISKEQVDLFRLAAQHLYRPPYRMSETDLIAYDLGFMAGTLSPARKLYEVDFPAFMDRTVESLRTELGIDTRLLRLAFREERRRLPGNKASARLDTS